MFIQSDCVFSLRDEDEAIISKSSIHAKSKHGFLTSYFFAESGIWRGKFTEESIFFPRTQNLQGVIGIII
jgi:hypothetical protein